MNTCTGRFVHIFLVIDELLNYRGGVLLDCRLHNHERILASNQNCKGCLAYLEF